MTTPRGRARTRASAAGVLVAVLAVGVTACGGSDEEDVEAGPGGTVLREETATTTGTAEPSEDAGPSGGGGGGAAERAAVDGTVVHYDGWAFELGEVRLAPVEPDPGTGAGPAQRLTVDVVVDNPGAADEAPAADEVTLEQDRVTVDATVPPDAEPLPVVPSGSRANGQLAWDVPVDLTLEGTELVFGGTDVQQARVPLAEGGGEPVTLAPIDVTSPGSGATGAVTTTITGGRLEFGDTVNHYPVAAGEAILVLDFDMAAGVASGDFQDGVTVADENVRLVLPDGTTVAPSDYPIEMLLDSSTLTGLRARFEVPDDVSGRLQLQVVGDYAGGQPAEGLVPFELPATTTAPG